MPRVRSDHDKLYGRAAWRRIRQQQLNSFPWCATCEARGVVTAAVICDHVEPHHGDPILFWTGKVQSLCESCHSGSKRFFEHRGWSDEIGLDGFPVDRNHPFYRTSIPD